MTPAICASGGLSDARVQRRPATISSSRGGSRRRSTPSAVARLTCTRLVWPVIALAAFGVDPETGEVRESDHGQLVADWVA